MGSRNKACVNNFGDTELNMRRVAELFMSWMQQLRG